MVSKESTGFERKPIPWMYSLAGSMLAAAIMKLSPIHRRLSELEIKNVQDYFNSDFVSSNRRRQINRLIAFMMTYFNAIHRLTTVSQAARQDYYALNRQGTFYTETLPVFDRPTHPDSPHLPLVIVPGLNTPVAFFREMYSYFTQHGYNVSVVNLPNNGLAAVADSAEVVQQEVEKVRETCQQEQVNVIGHCLGGLIAHYCLENFCGNDRSPAIKNIVSLGTGFMGAEGVEHLKNMWIPRHPNKPVPTVFDELIQWNLNVARKSTEVAYHSLLTIWDFMVHFRKGLLENPGGGMVTNIIIEDPAIDHLTIALNPRVFQEIERLLQGSPFSTPAIASFAAERR